MIRKNLIGYQKSAAMRSHTSHKQVRSTRGDHGSNGDQLVIKGSKNGFVMVPENSNKFLALYKQQADVSPSEYPGFDQ